MKKTILLTLFILLVALSGCRSYLTREDREAPEITVNPYQEEYFLGDEIPVISATCRDYFDETCLVTTPNYPDLSVEGEHTVTFRSEDSSGNVRIEEVTVVIINRANYITINVGDIITTAELGSLYLFPTVSCSSTESETCSVTLPQSLNTDEITSEIKYNIIGTDDQENSRTLVVSVEVVDTTAPIITLEGDAVVTVELGGTWTDPNVTTSDLQTVTVTTDITPDLNTVGEYIITYTAEDLSGNTSTVSRTVTVEDTTSPVITLEGDATVNLTVGGPWTDPGASATDLQSVEVTNDSATTFDINTPGTYTITYTATDASGNTATTTRTVIVT